MIEWFILYTRREPECSFCTEARELLQVYGKDYYEVDITDKGVKEMFSERGFRTVPQVFIEDHHIGGCNALKEYLRSEQEAKERSHRNPGVKVHVARTGPTDGSTEPRFCPCHRAGPDGE